MTTTNATHEMATTRILLPNCLPILATPLGLFANILHRHNFPGILSEAKRPHDPVRRGSLTEPTQTAAERGRRSGDDPHESPSRHFHIP
jgi:hypothetical protein